MAGKAKNQKRLAKLSFATIDHLADGAVADAVDRCIERALTDLDRHGRDNKARKVVIEVSLRTKVSRERTTFTANANVKCVLPDEKPKVTHGIIEVHGESQDALFNPNCANNPDQMVIPELEKVSEVV